MRFPHPAGGDHPDRVTDANDNPAAQVRPRYTPLDGVGAAARRVHRTRPAGMDAGGHWRLFIRPPSHQRAEAGRLTRPAVRGDSPRRRACTVAPLPAPRPTSFTRTLWPGTGAGRAGRTRHADHLRYQHEIGCRPVPLDHAITHCNLPGEADKVLPRRFGWRAPPRRCPRQARPRDGPPTRAGGPSSFAGCGHGDLPQHPISAATPCRWAGRHSAPLTAPGYQHHPSARCPPAGDALVQRVVRRVNAPHGEADRRHRTCAAASPGRSPVGVPPCDGCPCVGSSLRKQSRSAH